MNVPRAFLPPVPALILGVAFGLGMAHDPLQAQEPAAPAPAGAFLEESEFRYRMPPDWTAHQDPSLKFQVAAGPVRHGFVPNLTVVRQDSPAPLAACVLSTKRAMEQSPAFKGLLFLEEGPFTTREGLTGYRLAISDNMNRAYLRQVFYFFMRGEAKYVATGSCLVADADDIVPLLDASMGTFSWVNDPALVLPAPTLAGKLSAPPASMLMTAPAPDPAVTPRLAVPAPELEAPATPSAANPAPAPSPASPTQGTSAQATPPPPPKPKPAAPPNPSDTVP